MELAQKQGIELLALTDHDTSDGVREVLRTGKELGLWVLETDWLF